MISTGSCLCCWARRVISMRSACLYHWLSRCRCWVSPRSSARQFRASSALPVVSDAQAGRTRPGGSCCITCRRQRESGVIVGTTPACDMGDAPAPLLIAFGQCRWCGQGRSTERLSAVDGFGLFRILNNFLSENSEKKQFKLYRLIGSTTRLENGGYEWTRTTDLSIMSAAL